MGLLTCAMKGEGEVNVDPRSMNPTFDRDHNTDPNIKALKRRECIN